METRDDFCPGAPEHSATVDVLLSAVHLSDLHVCDAQSPARLELLDRFGDPDDPAYDAVGHVGSHRPQEILTTQVATAMVQAVNAIAAGPATGAAPSIALSTGDNVDNAQLNELQWYLAVLDGGEVAPDSGDRDRFEGVAGSGDPHYWQPETGGCRPTSLFGLPTVPGLLSAARRPFRSPGLTVPWLTTHGNHDRLVQGTLALPDGLGAFATGPLKPVGFPSDWTAGERVAFALALGDRRRTTGGTGSPPLGDLRRLRSVQVTPDLSRRFVSRREFIEMHGDGHGFTAGNRESGNAYYAHPLDGADEIVFLVLDTVNPHGYWQGSIDHEQFDWLRAELTAADDAGRYAVVASHHPASALTNDRTSDERRVLGPEVLAELTAHPSAVLWLSGHTHRHAVQAHRGRFPLWEATAASLIDAPQQARTVEVSRRADGLLAIDVRAVDHLGEAPWGGGTGDVLSLAGLSREIADLDWQESEPRPSDGEVNATLLLPDPFAG